MNFKLIILIIILLIIIIKINKKKKESFENKKVINNLYLFYSLKSDISMNVIPVWQQLKQLKIKNSDLTFYDINTDQYDSDSLESLTKKSIKSVPKIILKQNSIPIVYNGDFTLKDIIDFLKLKNVFVNHSLIDLD